MAAETVNKGFQHHVYGDEAIGSPASLDEYERLRAPRPSFWRLVWSFVLRAGELVVALWE